MRKCSPPLTATFLWEIFCEIFWEIFWEIFGKCSPPLTATSPWEMERTFHHTLFPMKVKVEVKPKYGREGFWTRFHQIVSLLSLCCLVGCNIERRKLGGQTKGRSWDWSTNKQTKKDCPTSISTKTSIWQKLSWHA